MFTLKDFLKLEYIKEYTLISPEILTEENNPQIKYISVMELPEVGDFIRKNELVLTTAIGCFENEELFLKLVQDVYSSKASALVISAHKPYPEIPKNILSFVKEKNFPIIYIPWEYRFADIIETVIKIISDITKYEKKLFDRIQKELLYSFLNNNNISSAAKIISSHVKSDIIITDNNFNVKGSSSENYNKKENFIFLNSNIIMKRLYTNTISYGYMIALNLNKKYSISEEYFEQYITIPLSLWFNKDNIIQQSTIKDKDEFIKKLILGNISNEKDIIIEYNNIGHKYTPPYTCIIGEIKLNNFYHLNESEIFFILLNTKIEIESILDLNKNNTSLVSILENRIIIFLEQRIYKTEDHINKFLDKIEKKLLQLLPSYSYYTWGISEILSESMDFKKKYQNAKLALTICIDENFSSRRGTYKDTNIFQVLSILAENDNVFSCANNFLKKIINYDKEKKQNLLKTISTFIKNNYNFSKTAKELNIHRQSLLYKISKIEELTNISFHNHEDLFLLEIYSRLIYNYNKK